MHWKEIDEDLSTEIMLRGHRLRNLKSLINFDCAIVWEIGINVATIELPSLFFLLLSIL
ncbi:hypothetical protein [Tychonema sp. LEGE 07203]|uniref:hypothetical protein n=1 Tax=Tychonema sp. LEGE 07203 TaxID=1828671 RepID=UPI00351C26A8